MLFRFSIELGDPENAPASKSDRSSEVSGTYSAFPAFDSGPRTNGTHKIMNAVEKSAKYVQ